MRRQLAPEALFQDGCPIAKPSFQEWLKEQVPTGRLAKPWEQAKLAAFLVSEDADFLVGAVIPFAGGDTL